MNPRILIISDVSKQPPLLEGEDWLVIGPFCWGRSRNLAKAVENAASNLSYGEGTFTARIVPSGDLTIESDGSYRVEGWTPEQQRKAMDTVRFVAVTKGAVKRWTDEARKSLREFNATEKKRGSKSAPGWSGK